MLSAEHFTQHAMRYRYSACLTNLWKTVKLFHFMSKYFPFSLDPFSESLLCSKRNMKSQM